MLAILSRVALWGALALVAVPGASGDCFVFPRGGDYAALLTPATRHLTPGALAEEPPSLAPLFDKVGYPGGSVPFFDPEKGGLEVTFTIPATLPLLDSVRLAGSGQFTLVAIDRWGRETLSQVIELNGPKDVPVFDDTAHPETAKIVITGTASGASLTALQLIATEIIAEPYEDTTNDGSSQPKDWQEDLPPASLPEVEGCTCLGSLYPTKTGGFCATWDNDCLDSGWCYVKPGACPDGKQSSSYPNLHWACALCANVTKAAPSTDTTAKPAPSDSAGQGTAAKGTTAAEGTPVGGGKATEGAAGSAAASEPDSATGQGGKAAAGMPMKPEDIAFRPVCGSCLWPSALGVLGGVAGGVVLMAVWRFCYPSPRGARRMPVELDSEECLGHSN